MGEISLPQDIPSASLKDIKISQAQRFADLSKVAPVDEQHIFFNLGHSKAVAPHFTDLLTAHPENVYEITSDPDNPLRGINFSKDQLLGSQALKNPQAQTVLLDELDKELRQVSVGGYKEVSQMLASKGKALSPEMIKSVEQAMVHIRAADHFMKAAGKRGIIWQVPEEIIDRIQTTIQTNIKDYADLKPSITSTDPNGG